MITTITIDIDEKLLDRARQLSGIFETTALIRAGLELLIASEAGKRLASLAGTDPGLSDIPRRRYEY